MYSKVHINGERVDCDLCAMLGNPAEKAGMSTSLVDFRSGYHALSLAKPVRIGRGGARGLRCFSIFQPVSP